MALSDWDFHGDLTYVLDNSIYVSSPSALRIDSGAATYFQPVLCRSSDVLVLAEGRIETQWRADDLSGTYAYPCLFFRQQSALGAFDTDNTYYFRLTSGGLQVRKIVATSETAIGTWTRAHSVDLWYQERFTWWDEASSLFFRYEYWNGSTWVIVTPDVADNSPSFGASAQNRCGVGLWRTSGAPDIFYDDTRIEWE